MALWAAGRSTTTIEIGKTKENHMHRKRKPMDTFSMINMSSGLAHGCVGPFDVLQNAYGGHQGDHTLIR